MIKKAILAFSLVLCAANAKADLGWFSPYVLLYTTNVFIEPQVFASSGVFRSSVTINGSLMVGTTFTVVGGTTTLGENSYAWQSTAPLNNSFMFYQNGRLIFVQQAGADGTGSGSGSNASFSNPSTGSLNMNNFGIDNASGVFVYGGRVYIASSAFGQPGAVLHVSSGEGYAETLFLVSTGTQKLFLVAGTSAYFQVPFVRMDSSLDLSRDGSSDSSLNLKLSARGNTGGTGTMTNMIVRLIESGGGSILALGSLGRLNSPMVIRTDGSAARSLNLFVGAGAVAAGPGQIVISSNGFLVFGQKPDSVPMNKYVFYGGTASFFTDMFIIGDSSATTGFPYVLISTNNPVQGKAILSLSTTSVPNNQNLFDVFTDSADLNVPLFGTEIKADSATVTNATLGNGNNGGLKMNERSSTTWTNVAIGYTGNSLQLGPGWNLVASSRTDGAVQRLTLQNFPTGQMMKIVLITSIPSGPSDAILYFNNQSSSAFAYRGIRNTNTSITSAPAVGLLATGANNAETKSMWVYVFDNNTASTKSGEVICSSADDQGSSIGGLDTNRYNWTWRNVTGSGPNGQIDRVDATPFPANAGTTWGAGASLEVYIGGPP